MQIDVDAWYRRYGPMVFRRCKQLLGDEAIAADAVQDTFVQLLRASARLDDRAPSSLLFRMATHVCLNRIRAGRRRPETPDDALLDRIADLEDPAVRSGARWTLERLFRREQPSTRTMAVLHLVDGMSLEEVARETGLSVSGVRKRLRGLRARLRELEDL